MSTPSRYTALPPTYDDSALSTWVGLPDSDIATLDSALKALRNELSPETFNAESLDDYGFALGTLLDQSGLNLSTQSRESLLTSRFISGLPSSIQKDMRKSREATTSFKEAASPISQGSPALPLNVFPVSNLPSSTATTPPTSNGSSPAPLQVPRNDNAPSVQALNGLNGVSTINAISDLANAMGNDNGTTTAEEAVAPNVMYLQRNANESH
ncbi:hypothetical protein FOL47_002776 [Perkinsus chesapeaki]|uniref:Uncharacterized protein n=1 Tax=Perkinsus chesapeaki TaxID=330153 RepID=A0A7J6N036_PERCH|nr:hypothetical protein FOL47_002776 [Perkinsus chesapeaki]